ncbi:MAG: sodium:calcium antiporter, partial [Bacteroidota bacterium]
MLEILGFIGCALIIFFAGKRLSYYGDLLAETTGLSKGWIGIILMASVTSLPELMVGISSASIVGSADLAVGDIIGSCAFNLGILAMLDAFTPKHKPIFGIASQTHILNAGLGIILIAMVGLTMFIPHHIAITPWIALSSIIFIFVYLISIRIIYYNEQNHPENNQHHNPTTNFPSTKTIIKNYTFFSSLIIIVALALPFFAEHIADMTGLEKSFVGTFFLAASTSLPEIAVSIAAVRMGSIDMAVGNLLGSNIFNILILAIDDLFYTKGLLLQDASPGHLISILSTILMSAIVIIGLSYHAKGKRYFLAWDAILIFIIYIINLFLLFYF